MLMGGFCNVNSSSVPNYFVCVVFMALIVTPARDQFLDDLHTRVNPSIPTVLAGDFNTVFYRSLNRAGSDPSDSSRESSSSLLNLFHFCCVIDMWRYLHPSASGFTWTSWKGTFTSRIDLIGLPYVWLSLSRLVISFRVLFLIIVVFL